MSEKFYFDFHQIDHVGVAQPDLDSQTRTDVNTVIRRPLDMKLSNFGALNVGLRMSDDYSRTALTYVSKDDLSDVNVITEDTGIGQNVRLFGVSVNHNPHVWDDSIKYVRDDQFIRMTMSKEGGTSSLATQIDPPKFDVMDTNLATAGGINDTSLANMKNWPSEGWRSFGGKYDYLPYVGGAAK